MTDPHQKAPTEAGILDFLATCAAFYPDDAVDASISQQRAWYDALCAHFDRPLPAGMVTEDRKVEERIPVRWYRPAEVKTETVLYYIHGGGFVVGSLDSHHAICAELAEHAGAELVSVDYRLAPEHVWPAAHDDAFAVLKSLLDGSCKVVLIGDSAGGNLAAGLALRAREEGIAGIVGQAVIYPALGGDLVSGSYAEMAQAPGLTTSDVAYYRTVLQAPEDSPVAHPLLSASLTGLSPTFITVAHFDPLRDDGRAYASRLAEAGVEVWFREEPQMVHAWLRARHMSEGARLGFEALCAAVTRFAAQG
ncbi:carboxylesterase [Rhizobium sp. Root274]|uniref:alpha/beta hydrolase n=1 Tax=unclassified Rhizobium TaxID=2613769 RepID=UPI0007136BCD|nr:MULTISPECIES: alpha/beta hydrolase [unclassified Rhizobium]KQW31864.1 carboxylesterase [Rhizobium sp. Root1240]KRD33403.1 carboxylesterase [Rhizobium sp. Root274]